MVPDFLEVYERLYASIGDLGWWPAETRDEVVVGAILTQNTSWKNVEKSLSVLREEGALNLKTISTLEPEYLSGLIRSSGFHNQKASRLIDLSKRILERYGSIERMKREKESVSADFLRNIKGVGRETLDSLLVYALDKPVFVVDKYTERIFSRLGLLSEKYEMEDFRSDVKESFGSDVGKLKNFHGMIVQLAKDHCRKKPLCEGCPLSEICGYYTDVMLP